MNYKYNKEENKYLKNATDNYILAINSVIIKRELTHKGLSRKKYNQKPRHAYKINNENNKYGKKIYINLPRMREKMLIVCKNEKSDIIYNV